MIDAYCKWLEVLGLLNYADGFFEHFLGNRRTDTYTANVTSNFAVRHNHTLRYPKPMQANAVVRSILK